MRACITTAIRPVPHNIEILIPLPPRLGALSEDASSSQSQSLSEASDCEMFI